MGLLKAVAVSWVLGWETTVERVGFKSAAIFTYGYGAAVTMAIGLSSALWDPIDDNMYLLISIPAGVVVFIGTTIWAFVERREKDVKFREWGGKVIFAGPEILRNVVSQLHLPDFKYLWK